jgi:hypothetical protein
MRAGRELVVSGEEKFLGFRSLLVLASVKLNSLGDRQQKVAGRFLE